MIWIVLCNLKLPPSNRWRTTGSYAAFDSNFSASLVDAATFALILLLIANTSVSSENLAVTMEMNNEAIRYIEALREQ